MVLDGVGEAGLGVPRGAGAPAAAVGGGGGGPPGLDGGKRVGEHRWRPKKLATGSFGREEGWRRELRGRPTSGDANGGHGKRRSRERERERRGRLRQHGEGSGEERAGLRARQGRHGRGRAS